MNRARLLHWCSWAGTSCAYLLLALSLASILIAALVVTLLLTGCSTPPVVAVAAPLDFSRLDAKVVRAQRLNGTIDQRAARIQRTIAHDKEIIDRK